MRQATSDAEHQLMADQSWLAPTDCDAPAAAAAAAAAAEARLRACLQSDAALYAKYELEMRSLWSIPSSGLPMPVRTGFVSKRRPAGTGADQLWLLDSTLNPIRPLVAMPVDDRLLDVQVSPSGAMVACSIVRPGSNLVSWHLADVTQPGDWVDQVNHPGRPVRAAWTPESDGLVYFGVPSRAAPGLYWHPLDDGATATAELITPVDPGDGIDELALDSRHHLVVYARKRAATEHRRDLVFQPWPPNGPGSRSFVLAGTATRFIGSTYAGPCLLNRRRGVEIGVLPTHWSGSDIPDPRWVWRDPAAESVSAAYAIDDVAVLATWSGTSSAVRVVNLRTQQARTVALSPGTYVADIAAWDSRDTVALVTSSFASRDRYLALPLAAVRPTPVVVSAVGVSADPLAEDAALRTETLAVSASDGATIQVFVSGRRTVLDDRRPAALARRRTIVVAYGGFGVPVVPRFRFAWRLWMDSGGIIAVAAVRGGGERGRRSHQEAIGAGKVRTFADLHDVAVDLAHRGLCSPSGPVLYGHSNGGLTVAATFMRWPQLFAGLVVENALLDMVNYEELNPDNGAWRHEFGSSSDPSARRTLASYSPVEAVRPGRTYPPLLVMVGTADQTVNPQHSYRFVARLAELSPMTPTHLMATPGTHGLSTTPSQLSSERAVILTFADRALEDAAQMPPADRWR